MGDHVYQVEDRECPGVALYPTYCLLNHACYNNTNYLKFKDLHLELRWVEGEGGGGSLLFHPVTNTGCPILLLGLC